MKPDQVGPTGPYPDTDPQFQGMAPARAMTGVVQQLAVDAASSEAFALQRAAESNMQTLREKS